MWYESGDVSHHDSEVNEARWFDSAEATSALAFRSERSIVERALLMASA
jgi:NADH pyrophosphatase NudC (nudix superfamily)